MFQAVSSQDFDCKINPVQHLSPFSQIDGTHAGVIQAPAAFSGFQEVQFPKISAGLTNMFTSILKVRFWSVIESFERTFSTRNQELGPVEI